MVEFAFDGKSGEPWVLKSTATFENDLYLVNYEGNCHTSSYTVRRAKSVLDRARYDPLTNNCDHFATGARTGQLESRQTETCRNIFGRKLLVIACRLLGVIGLPRIAAFYKDVDAFKNAEKDWRTVFVVGNVNRTWNVSESIAKIFTRERRILHFFEQVRSFSLIILLSVVYTIYMIYTESAEVTSEFDDIERGGGVTSHRDQKACRCDR